MYIVGHTAYAYLILRPFMRTKNPNSMTLANTIFFIFIIANVIDMFNYRIFRYLGHNLFGTFFITGLWLVVLYKLKLIKLRTFPIFFIASGSHVVADYFFSEYYLLAPFNDATFSVYQYNPMIGMIAESILLMIFLIVFIGTKDYWRLKKFINIEKKKVMRGTKSGEIVNSGVFISILFLVFYIFILAQFAVFIVSSRYYIIHSIYIPWTYIGAFLLFTLLFTMIGFGKEKPHMDRKVKKSNIGKLLAT